VQSLDLQIDALTDAGAERVYRDIGSGSLKHRPQLDACLDYLRAGDTLVVWRLDRLGRGLKHLIDLVEQLHGSDIGFRSLTEQIDTTTPAGRLQFHLFGALAEFEREIIRERTRAGLAAARARGRTGGRPIALTPGEGRGGECDACQRTVDGPDRPGAGRSPRDVVPSPQRRARRGATGRRVVIGANSPIRYS
jgi:DNA invertase Pin-like site-specific DNA recombinase